MQSSGTERRILDEADFPSMGGTGTAPFTAHGYAASAAGRNAPKPEEFPALPGIKHGAWGVGQRR